MLLFSSFLISGLYAASASIQFNKPKIKEGEQLIVTCDLSGFGADVKFRILKEQEQIFLSEAGDGQASPPWQVSGNSISKQADRIDMAEYKCIAEDSAKNFALTERELIVLVPPSLPVIVEPSDKKLIVGKAGELVCIADGSPQPTYTWHKIDKATGTKLQLPADARTDKRYFANSQFTVDGNTVKFLNVTENDAGEYFCTARNEAGQSEGEPTFIGVGSLNIASVVGIVFAVIFGVALIGIIAFVIFKKVTGGDSDSYVDENEVFDDEGNDVAMGESYDPYEHHKGTSRQDFSHREGEVSLIA
ncbi:Oidioi.mRNA.OKI2018_I69.chr2.g4260.t1.cds [Oikopleura dioica]|uniref:Oidioi.mRNA.OKI2018_I69.chr2.g4260.t1.cds n=1 Tax=Oikopleura dioica TaxID=34765 RepID=A0ABN7SWS2_OIKDI|nr:Oidioi.mRNA.OKI2018_I69.chr2.g4260.t1.cds [Oikopleura dioica]